MGTASSYKLKLPPYGKQLADRQSFNNLPLMVAVCVGRNAWDNAKHWNGLPNDCAALVLPPDTLPMLLNWPVSRCICLIDWGFGPNSDLIVCLIQELLIAGAVSVTAWPRWVDYSKPIVEYDAKKPIGDRWVQTRECIRTYQQIQQEIWNAA